MKERRLTSVKSTIGALALISGIAVSGSAWAANSDALIGNWKLVSWQVVVGNETRNPFGSSPRGYLLLTPGGRAMAITTAGSRKPGDGVAERAALHKSMLAYSGKYRIEGSDFITTVDISWNETGTAPSRGVTIGSKAIGSSSSRPRRPASCIRARLIFAGSYGSERSRAVGCSP